MARIDRFVPSIRGMPRNFRFHLRTVFLAPIVVGLIAGYVLLATPQAREVYQGLFFEGDVGRAAIGIVLVALLALQLETWHRMLGKAAIDRIYPEHADIGVDRRLTSWNRLVARFAGAIPLAALVAGVIITALNGYTLEREIARVHAAVASASAATAPSAPAPWYETVLWRHQALITAVSVALAFAAVAGTAIWIGAYAERQLDPIRTSHRLRLAIVAITATIAGLGLAVPLFPPSRDFVVPLAQFIGPLGAIALTFIPFVSLFMLLTYLSSVLRWPVMGTAMSLAAAALAYQLQASVNIRQAAPRDAPTPIADSGTVVTRDAGGHTGGPAPYSLSVAFDEWLAARPDRDAFVRDGYPVFIVAAQGGGIYAAAAALSFLTSMQDECPGFAQHVFAISAVSGGAVGAAVFNALVANAPAVNQPCGARPKENLAARATAIVERDHLSPALLQLWTDQFGKIFPTRGAALDRSIVLERSFACGFDASESAMRACGPASVEAGTGLRAPFEAHWDPGKQPGTPALVLNATWGETGYRAAFSPFELRPASDGTMFVFPSAKLTGDFATAGVTPQHTRRSLIEAAFVSARFPGIVPPYQVRFDSAGRKKVWNFVDGGYVDNSGATTATEIYLALRAHLTKQTTLRGVAAGKAAPRLFLILLTDVTTDPDVVAVASGTTLQDTVAPATALLNVRGQLADRAVTRAVSLLAADPGNLSARSEPIGNLLVVSLKQTDFELPLGWKLSRRTHDVIKTLLGRHELCDADKFRHARQDEARRVIVDNSCVKRGLRGLLGASP